MNQSSSPLRKLMEMLAHTQAEECDCGQVYALLDAYCEAVDAGEDVSQLYPQVMQHLLICPDCVQEYSALLQVLQSQHLAS
jgi:hypothetical protein